MKKIMDLGGDAGSVTIDSRNEYVVLQFSTKAAAEKYAAQKGLIVQAKIENGRMKNFTVIIRK